jgi:hypothetical protein
MADGEGSAGLEPGTSSMSEERRRRAVFEWAMAWVYIMD